MHADQFFKPQSCAKLLTDFRNETDSSDSDKTASTLSVRIVVNQKFFNDTSVADYFSRVYGCGIDGRLEQLSSAFRSGGVNSEIIKLSSSTDLAATFRKYLIHDKEYVGMPDLMLSPLFKRLSDDVTASVCVNVATGDLSWWSVPLTRVYAANPGKVAEYYSTRNEKQKLWMQMPGAHYGKGRQQQVLLEVLKSLLTNAKNTTSPAKHDTSSK